MVSELESMILKVIRKHYPHNVNYEQIVSEVNELSKREIGKEWNPEYICRQTRRMQKKSMIEGNGVRGFRISFNKKKYATLDNLAKSFGGKMQ